MKLVLLLIASAQAVVVQKGWTPPPGAYVIQDPALRNTKNDDAFLTKVFEKYSTHDPHDGDDEHGDRFLTKDNARWAAREVVGRWKNLSGDALDKAIDANFDSAWHNYDTQDKGKISVKTAQYWIRQVAGEEWATGFKGYKF